MAKFDLKEYLDSYFADCEHRKRLNEKTLKAYKYDLTQFLDFIHDELLNRDRIKAYIHYLSKTYEKSRTIKRKVASVKAFYYYLEREEIIEYSPFQKIKTKIKENKELPKIIQDDDLHKIYSYILCDINDADLLRKKEAIRKAAILELLFSTGMRVSELCNIKNQNIDLQSRLIKILGKGSKERMIYIGESSLIELLEEYACLFQVEIESEGYFLLNRSGRKINEQTVRNLLNSLEQKLELKKHITPHMFRHTFATSLLDKDVDIRYIQQILGHSSISTTQIYTHVSNMKQKEILTNKNPLSDYV